MLILLDRDGVINEDTPNYIKTPEEWIPIRGSLEAIAALNQAGHRVIVVTNQSGIGRKLYHPADLAEIHAHMQRSLSVLGGHIDAIFYCPHHPDAQCACRKPKPGMLLGIEAQFQVNLREAILIGDTLKDVCCAQAVGCQPFLVKTGYGEKTLQDHPQKLQGIPVFENLAQAVQQILQQADG